MFLISVAQTAGLKVFLQSQPVQSVDYAPWQIQSVNIDCKKISYLLGQADRISDGLEERLDNLHSATEIESDSLGLSSELFKQKRFISLQGPGSEIYERCRLVSGKWKEQVNEKKS